MTDNDLKMIWKVIAEIEASMLTIVEKLEEQEEYIRSIAEELEGNDERPKK